MTDDTQENLIRDLMGRHQRQLLFFIRSIYPNLDAAEDILQETNKVIWLKRDKFESGSNFMAWASTIAKFQTLSHLKNRRSKSWLQFDSYLVQGLAQKMEERESFIETRKAYLEECVGSLRDKDQELVLRKYQRKETNKTISRETGRSEGGLKQAFLRIRRLLRECVERKEVSAK